MISGYPFPTFIDIFEGLKLKRKDWKLTDLVISESELYTRMAYLVILSFFSYLFDLYLN